MICTKRRHTEATQRTPSKPRLHPVECLLQVHQAHVGRLGKLPYAPSRTPAEGVGPVCWNRSLARLTSGGSWAAYVLEWSPANRLEMISTHIHIFLTILPSMKRREKLSVFNKATVFWERELSCAAFLRKTHTHTDARGPRVRFERSYLMTLDYLDR